MEGSDLAAGEVSKNTNGSIKTAAEVGGNHSTILRGDRRVATPESKLKELPERCYRLPGGAQFSTALSLAVQQTPVAFLGGF